MEKLFIFAAIVAKNSTCLGQQVGAVVGIDGKPIAAGWNRQPLGIDTCTERGYCTEQDQTCLTQACPSRAIHAEMVALGTAAQSGVSCRGASLYVTHRPCFACIKAAVSHGIEAIYWYGEDYSPDDAIREWAIPIIRLYFQGSESDLVDLCSTSTSDLTYPVIVNDKPYRSIDRAAHYSF
jgi:dCMP deaminase